MCRSRFGPAGRGASFPAAVSVPRIASRFVQRDDPGLSSSSFGGHAGSPRGAVRRSASCRCPTRAEPAVEAHRAGGEAQLGGSVVGGAGAEAGPVCRVRGSVGFGPGGSVGARAGRGGSRRGEVEGRDARRGDRSAGGGAAPSRRGGPAPQGGRRTARSGTAPGRGEAGRGEKSLPNGARPPARGRGVAARKPGGHRSGVERGRQRRDDGREHQCGPRRRRRDGQSTAEARLSREGAVRDAGRRRGARRSPRGPQPVLVAHGDAD